MQVSSIPYSQIDHFQQENSNTSQKLKQICLVAYRAIKAFVVFLKDTLLFPVRYVGTKFGLNHQFFHKGFYPKDKLLKNMDLVCSTALVHSSDKKWIEPFGYEVLPPKSFAISSSGLEKKDLCFFDPKSGLKAAVSLKENKVIISFGALRSHHSEVSDDKMKKSLHLKMYWSAMGNMTGITPKVYLQAEVLFKDLMKDPRLKGKNIILTGQCFGGSIASYVALNNDTEAFCTNSLQLGAGLQQKLGRKKLKKARDLITHLTVKSDWVSDRKIYTVLDVASSIFCIKTPGRFGEKFMIPTAYEDRSKSHDYSIGSCMKYLGMDIRSTPEDLLSGHMA